MKTVIVAASPSGLSAAVFGFAGVLVGALATILVGIVNYREARSGQVTDRLTRAVEQLGSGNPQVRMGAIYALEQIAYDSKPPLVARWHALVASRVAALTRSSFHPAANRHQSYVAYVATLLAAMVRSRSHLNDKAAPEGAVLKVRAPDVQAALTVLCRLPVCNDHVLSEEKGRLDLSRSDIKRASLRQAQLQRADLSGALLQGADLREANMQGIVLKEANLGPAPGSRYRDGADLRDANLAEANLAGTVLDRAILTGAVLDGAIWSKTTYWPEVALSQIQARSTEIEPDKFRIGAPPAAKASPRPAEPALDPAGADLASSADGAGGSR